MGYFKACEIIQSTIYQYLLTCVHNIALTTPPKTHSIWHYLTNISPGLLHMSHMRISGSWATKWSILLRSCLTQDVLLLGASAAALPFSSVHLKTEIFGPTDGHATSSWYPWRGRIYSYLILWLALSFFFESWQDMTNYQIISLKIPEVSWSNEFTRPLRA